MAVKPNAQMILQPDWLVSEDGIRFHFLCPDPGPGEASDYYVFFTQAEFAAITNSNQLDTELAARLNLLVRGTAIAAKAQTLVNKVYVV